MVAEIGYPTGDTGKGAGGKVTETRRDRTTGTAQDLVAYKVVTLVEDRTGITLEAEVHEGGMVTTPTPSPNRTDIECVAAVRTAGMEIGRSREKVLIGGMGKMK